jgi:hypothetical protein
MRNKATNHPCLSSTSDGTLHRQARNAGRAQADILDMIQAWSASVRLASERMV